MVDSSFHIIYLHRFTLIDLHVQTTGQNLLGIKIITLIYTKVHFNFVLSLNGNIMIIFPNQRVCFETEIGRKLNYVSM